MDGRNNVNAEPAWWAQQSVPTPVKAGLTTSSSAFERSLQERSVAKAAGGGTTVALAFDELLSAIEPTPAERTEASAQQTRVRDKLNALLSLIATYLSGSYRRRTLRRPVTDIDLLTLLDAVKHGITLDAAGAKKALDLVQAALAKAFPTTELNRDYRCIMLQFAGTGIGFDVVPVIQIDEHTFWMPDEQRGTWILTNPREVERLVTEANREVCGGWLVPLVKLLKTWKRHCDIPLRGFHLEALAYHALKHAPANEREGLQYLFEQLSTMIYAPTPDIWPYGEDASASLTTADRSRAAGALAVAAQIAKEANDAERAGRTDEAHRKWHSLFGDEYPETGAARVEARRTGIAEALKIIERNAPFTATPAGIAPMVTGLAGVRSSTSHGTFALDADLADAVTDAAVEDLDAAQVAYLEHDIARAQQQFPGLKRVRVADAVADERLWPVTERDADRVYAVLVGVQRTNYGTAHEILVKVFKDTPAREPRVYMLRQRVARRPVSRKGRVTFLPTRPIRHQWGDRAMCSHALRDKWDGRLVTLLVYAANWLLRQEHYRRTGHWIGHEIDSQGDLLVNGRRARAHTSRPGTFPENGPRRQPL